MQALVLLVAAFCSLTLPAHANPDAKPDSRPELDSTVKPVPPPAPESDTKPTAKAELLLAPDQVVIWPGAGFACDGSAVAPDRIALQNITVKNPGPGTLALTSAQILLEHPAIAGGRHECQFNDAQLAYALGFPKATVPPGVIGVGRCTLQCGGIQLATAPGGTIGAHLSIEGKLSIEARLVDAQGAESPVLLTTPFTAYRR